MGNSAEIDEKFIVMFSNTQYKKIIKDNLIFIIHKLDDLLRIDDFNGIASLWNCSEFIYNKIDYISHIEKNRWGKTRIWVLSKNIKFGNIICKLNKK